MAWEECAAAAGGLESVMEPSVDPLVFAVVERSGCGAVKASVLFLLCLILSSTEVSIEAAASKLWLLLGAIIFYARLENDNI